MTSTDWAIDEAREVIRYVKKGLLNGQEPVVVDYVAAKLRLVREVGHSEGLNSAREVIRSK